jgi:dihydrofolate synthase/folylpolyglutamate synthase
LGVPSTAISEGISRTQWPGRLEELSSGGRRFLVDAGHNPAGIRSLTNYLKENNIDEVELGFGVLSTKNWKEMVDELVPFVKSWNLLSPDSGSAVDPHEVGDYLSSLEISSQSFGTRYVEFFQEMGKREGSNAILLTGSIYLIGRLREHIVKQDKRMW